MLLSLTIRDVVLIERLDLDLAPQLSVLTGETGAGKSILLDALGLALGFRAEAGLVRQGAQQAAVTAAFDLTPDHPARALMAEQGIEVEDTLTLRRIVTTEGRSRAFVNDQPASVGLLRQLGATLVEIQGQFEQYGLLDPATHRALLDAFAAGQPKVDATAATHKSWRKAHGALVSAETALKEARAEEDYLRHALAELDALSPEPEEEERLSETRALLMHRAQVIEATSGALAEIDGDRGAVRQANNAARLLEKARDKAGGMLDAAIAAVERTLIEATEAAALLETAAREFDGGEDRLDKVEERLFELRAQARKHQVATNDLPALRDEIAARLSAIDLGESGLGKLRQAEQDAREKFLTSARALSAQRKTAAAKLDKAIAAELPPLKLDRARFATSLDTLPEEDWTEDGAERVAFEVATNPGSAPGPLGKIASGGELSRFLLALKLVLARVATVPTLVFDEVDSGIGGAVAAAVGERLHRLGSELQVLVVTHSPQVAARGTHHWRVAKSAKGTRVETRIERLDDGARREEIARMLAGAEVTTEARAAADQLLSLNQPQRQLNLS